MALAWRVPSTEWTVRQPGSAYQGESRLVYSLGRAANHTRLAALALIAAMTASGCMASVEAADDEVSSVSEALSSCGPPVPAELAVPDGNKLAFNLLGVGAQIYDCKLAAD